MSRPDQFDAWAWDREQFNAGAAGLVIQRHGREVRADRWGVSIDGRRVVQDDLRRTGADTGFAVSDDGSVRYRGRVVARIAPPQAGRPGQVFLGDGPQPERPVRHEPERLAVRQVHDLALPDEEMDL